MVNTISKELVTQAISQGFIHCKYIHDGSCEIDALKKFIFALRLGVMYYLPIHLIPVIIYKRKLIFKQYSHSPTFHTLIIDPFQFSVPFSRTSFNPEPSWLVTSPFSVMCSANPKTSAAPSTLGT